jgi:hypothetical protein
VQDTFIPAKERTPEVDFRFGEHHLSMKGEAYPEDAAAFFGPLLRSLAEYCATVQDQALRVAFQLDYFNTSSAKALMNMIQLLESAARTGTPVELRWHYQKDDEVMREFGEDFATELEHVDFQLIEV